MPKEFLNYELKAHGIDSTDDWQESIKNERLTDFDRLFYFLGGRSRESHFDLVEKFLHSDDKIEKLILSRQMSLRDILDCFPVGETREGDKLRDHLINYDETINIDNDRVYDIELRILQDVFATIMANTPEMRAVRAANQQIKQDENIPENDREHFKSLVSIYGQKSNINYRGEGVYAGLGAYPALIITYQRIFQKKINYHKKKKAQEENISFDEVGDLEPQELRLIERQATEKLAGYLLEAQKIFDRHLSINHLSGLESKLNFVQLGEKAQKRLLKANLHRRNWGNFIDKSGDNKYAPERNNLYEQINKLESQIPDEEKQSILQKSNQKEIDFTKGYINKKLSRLDWSFNNSRQKLSQVDLPTEEKELQLGRLEANYRAQKVALEKELNDAFSRLNNRSIEGLINDLRIRKAIVHERHEKNKSLLDRALDLHFYFLNKKDKQTNNDDNSDQEEDGGEEKLNERNQVCQEITEFPNGMINWFELSMGTIKRAHKALNRGVSKKDILKMALAERNNRHNGITWEDMSDFRLVMNILSEAGHDNQRIRFIVLNIDKLDLAEEHIEEILQNEQLLSDRYSVLEIIKRLSEKHPKFIFKYIKQKKEIMLNPHSSFLEVETALRSIVDISQSSWGNIKQLSKDFFTDDELRQIISGIEEKSVSIDRNNYYHYAPVDSSIISFIWHHYPQVYNWFLARCKSKIAGMEEPNIIGVKKNYQAGKENLTEIRTFYQASAKDFNLIELFATADCPLTESELETVLLNFTRELIFTSNPYSFYHRDDLVATAQYVRENYPAVYRRFIESSKVMIKGLTSPEHILYFLETIKIINPAEEADLRRFFLSLVPDYLTTEKGLEIIERNIDSRETVRLVKSDDITTIQIISLNNWRAIKNGTVDQKQYQKNFNFPRQQQKIYDLIVTLDEKENYRKNQPSICCELDGEELKLFLGNALAKNGEINGFMSSNRVRGFIIEAAKYALENQPDVYDYFIDTMKNEIKKTTDIYALKQILVLILEVNPEAKNDLKDFFLTLATGYLETRDGKNLFNNIVNYRESRNFSVLKVFFNEEILSNIKKNYLNQLLSYINQDQQKDEKFFSSENDTDEKVKDKLDFIVWLDNARGTEEISISPELYQVATKIPADRDEYRMIAQSLIKINDGQRSCFNAMRLAGNKSLPYRGFSDIIIDLQSKYLSSQAVQFVLNHTVTDQSKTAILQDLINQLPNQFKQIVEILDKIEKEEGSEKFSLVAEEKIVLRAREDLGGTTEKLYKVYRSYVKQIDQAHRDNNPLEEEQLSHKLRQFVREIRSLLPILFRNKSISSVLKENRELLPEILYSYARPTNKINTVEDVSKIISALGVDREEVYIGHLNQYKFNQDGYDFDLRGDVPYVLKSGQNVGKTTDALRRLFTVNRKKFKNDNVSEEIPLEKTVQDKQLSKLLNEIIHGNFELNKKLEDQGDSDVWEKEKNGSLKGNLAETDPQKIKETNLGILLSLLGEDEQVKSFQDRYFSARDLTDANKYGCLNEAIELLGIYFWDNYPKKLYDYAVGDQQTAYELGKIFANPQTVEKKINIVKKQIGDGLRNKNMEIDWDKLRVTELSNEKIKVIADIISSLIYIKFLSKFKQSITKEVKEKFKPLQEQSAEKDHGGINTNKYKAYFSKNFMSFLARSSAGLCTSDKTGYFKWPTHFHLNIVENEERIVGNNHFYVIDYPAGQKSLLLRGFNPCQSWENEINIAAYCKRVIEIARQFKEDNQLAGVYLSEELGSWHALSNRDRTRNYLEKTYLKAENMASFHTKITEDTTIDSMYKVA